MTREVMRKRLMALLIIAVDLACVAYIARQVFLGG
jgi:hypothetical protein